jgi:predicted RNase H-like HicB family nuclease
MKYTVVLLADPRGGYTALVPALPGCVSEGDSVDEAMDMVSDAIRLYRESSEEHGEQAGIEYPTTLIGELNTDSGDYWVKEAGLWRER